MANTQEIYIGSGVGILLIVIAAIMATFIILWSKRPKNCKDIKGCMKQESCVNDAKQRYAEGCYDRCSNSNNKNNGCEDDYKACNDSCDSTVLGSECFEACSDNVDSEGCTKCKSDCKVICDNKKATCNGNCSNDCGANQQDFRGIMNCDLQCDNEERRGTMSLNSCKNYCVNNEGFRMCMNTTCIKGRNKDELKGLSAGQCLANSASFAAIFGPDPPPASCNGDNSN